MFYYHEESQTEKEANTYVGQSWEHQAGIKARLLMTSRTSRSDTQKSHRFITSGLIMYMSQWLPFIL